MEPSSIDRLSKTLVNVNPELSTVTTVAQLRAWADAVIHQAGTEPGGQDGTTATTPASEDCAHKDTDFVSAAASFPLRDWEQGLSQALARLQAAHEISASADTATLGPAFAALVYGGLLLGQAAGDVSPLRAAMDMALAQVDRPGAH